MRRSIGSSRLTPIALVSVALLAWSVHSPARSSQVSGPPEVTLTATSGAQGGRLGSYCWPQPGGFATCHDVFGRGPGGAHAYLPVLKGERISFKIHLNEKPNSVVLHAFRVTPGAKGGGFPLRAATSQSWRVSLRPGRYVLSLGVIWKYDGPSGRQQKDGGWGFGIEVLGARTLPKSGLSDGFRPFGVLALSLALAGAWLLRRRRALPSVIRTRG